MWHGYYFDSHRGMNDVTAMIKLSTDYKIDNRTYLLELIKKSFKPDYLLTADFKYKKDWIPLFKAMGFYYNSDNKTWNKSLDHNQINEHYELVKEKRGETGYVVTVREIPLIDRYKI